MKEKADKCIEGLADVGSAKIQKKEKADMCRKWLADVRGTRIWLPDLKEGES
jgi:hypothetical protein